MTAHEPTVPTGGAFDVTQLPYNLKTRAGLSTSTSSGTDVANSTALANAFAAQGSVDYDLPGGGYKVASDVVIPSGGTFLGRGRDYSKIILGAGARVRCGENFASAGGVAALNAAPSWNGGTVGKFTVDGGGVAPVGMHFGKGAQREIKDTRVVNCAAGTGNQGAVLFEYAQNHWFSTFLVEANNGHGVVVDKGAGGLRFEDFEIDANAYSNIWIPSSVQEDASLPGYPDVVTDVVFRDGICERQRSASEIGNILIDGCADVFFEYVRIVGAGSTTANSQVRVRTAQAKPTYVSFDGCKLQGNQSYTIAFDAMSTTGTSIIIKWLGAGRLQNHLVGLSADDNVRFIYNNELWRSSGSVTTFFANQNGGTRTASQVMIPMRAGSVLPSTVDPPTDSNVFGANVEPLDGAFALTTGGRLYLRRGGSW